LQIDEGRKFENFLTIKMTDNFKLRRRKLIEMGENLPERIHNYCVKLFRLSESDDPGVKADASFRLQCYCHLTKMDYKEHPSSDFAEVFTNRLIQYVMKLLDENIQSIEVDLLLSEAST
jgi:hypothetical protein